VRKRIFVNMFVMVAALIVSLALVETALSIMAKSEALNPFSALGYSLEPGAIRVNELRRRLDAFLANVDSANYISDASTGWTYRPDALLFDGRFTTNSLGMRAAREFSEAPPADTIRIAAFGDSFTAGADVKDDEVWTHALETALLDRHIRAEVLNFGVGGYGMDQAYLRWQNAGSGLSADIIIFGFQPENLQRNVSVFRPIYARKTGIPLSKPRYTLQGEELVLLNYPALPPSMLMEAYEDFDSHPLSAYEFYYYDDSPIPDWWPLPRLANLFKQATAKPPEPRDDLGPDSERGQLGKAIAGAFAEDVAQAGASFVVIHLPTQRDLASYHNVGRPRYTFLLEYFEANFTYLNGEAVLGPEFVEARYWGGTGHYGPEINEAIGEALAFSIVSCIDDGACPLPRFDAIEPAFLLGHGDEA
jgi:hypothetical protein